MPRQVMQTVYTYQEIIDLGGSRAERAKQWLREVQTDNEWWDTTYELWVEALSSIGFENAEISFSGFSCQGDGASFTADVDFGKLASFLSRPMQPNEVIDYTDGVEDFASWILHKVGWGEQVFNRHYDWFIPFEDHFHCEVTRGDSRYSHEHTCSFSIDCDALGRRGEWVREKPGDYGEWLDACRELQRVVEDFREEAEDLRLNLSRAIYRTLEDEYEYLTGDENLLESAEANGYEFDELGRPV